MLFVYIGIGGAVGAIARHLISQLNDKAALPIGTLLANVIGSFLLGYLYFYFKHALIPEEMKLAITSGLLASLTTYSTIQLQMFQFIQDQEYYLFTLYFFLNIFVGLLSIFIARWVFDITV
jgi:CrcB protein